MKNKISFILISLILSFGCVEQKVNYLKEGEKLFVNNQNDKVKIKKAIEYFKKELQQNPESRLAAKYLAIAYSNISQTDSSQIIINRIIYSNEKEMAELYELKGMNSFIMKDYSGSISDFENSIKYYGGKSTIYNHIIISKIWQKYNKDGNWLDFSNEDVANIIDLVYPDHLQKPSVQEFNNIAK